MKFGIISQARTGSRRLKGKVLLTANGKSFLEHHIDRLRMAEIPIIIATTTNEKDDKIVEICNRLGVCVFRGSESNVLSRYYDAAKLYNLDYIVRVTSDCPLIDGNIVKEGIIKYKELIAMNESLYFSNTIERSYPKGADFEIFSFKMIENVVVNDKANQFQKEHVTPYFYQTQNIGINLFSLKKVGNYSKIRITIDYFEDYIFMKNLIENHNASQKSIFELEELITNDNLLSDQNKICLAQQYKSKLILGTAQFGQSYGINNKIGLLSKENIFNILKFAKDSGLGILDTADLYGSASERISDFHLNSDSKFGIITKFKNIDDKTDLEGWLLNNQVKLNVPKINTVLFHSFSEYLANSNLSNQLIQLKSKNLLDAIGVSIYSNSELEHLLEDDNIDVIQIPFNLLDNSEEKLDLIKKAKSRGKIIHARSIFLQGLFFININNLPNKLSELKQPLMELNSLAKEYEFTLESLALNYVLNNDLIDGVLIGIDSLEQLKINLNAIGLMLSDELIQKVEKIKVENISLLNPTNWK
jgi:spore coat polysaccharide biosynthesis protein SpsF (cytidylyltransferase family)/aryl-alcohol dehydrogenase-like predicted oxidoreductase